MNNIRLLGLNHVEVVTILKELPQNVRIVCARRRADAIFTYGLSTCDQFFQIPSPPSTSDALFNDRLIKAKSEQTLSLLSGLTPTDPTASGHVRSRSLEPLSGLAMWGSQVVVIELEKGDRGLGFSILDYQDPINPDETVIVIRSLVPGGVAQLDGRLVPGDRLVFVNDTALENASLDEAVDALKGAHRGLVQLGVVKPLPLPEVDQFAVSVFCYNHANCVFK